MYSEHVGSLFDSDADVLGHGTNCRGLMGAGIATLFKKRLSHQEFESYVRRCKSSGSANLGTVQMLRWGGPQRIANMFTQVEPGANAEYSALVSCLAQYALNYADDIPFQTLAIPQIGCGIGGLEWKHVKPIIQGFAQHTDIQVWALNESDFDESS